MDLPFSRGSDKADGVKSMEIEKKIQTLRQTRQYIDKKISSPEEGRRRSKIPYRYRIFLSDTCITSDYNGLTRMIQRRVTRPRGSFRLLRPDGPSQCYSL